MPALKFHTEHNTHTFTSSYSDLALLFMQFLVFVLLFFVDLGCVSENVKIWLHLKVMQAVLTIASTKQ